MTLKPGEDLPTVARLLHDKTKMTTLTLYSFICADSESEEEDFVDNFLQEEDGLEPPKPPRIPHRWRVTIMMALAFVLCNMDKVCRSRLIKFVLNCCVDNFYCMRMIHKSFSCRLSQGRTKTWKPVLACNIETLPLQVNMSVAVIPMAEELGWSASDRGLVSSAFFWGYSATQVPAGYISTK